MGVVSSANYKVTVSSFNKGLYSPFFHLLINYFPFCQTQMVKKVSYLVVASLFIIPQGTAMLAFHQKAI